MDDRIQCKSAKIQFWGSPRNPGHQGISFHDACCPCDCWKWEDNFNRGNSTNIGTDWSEISGDWEILDYELFEPSTTDAKVIGTNPVPAGSAGEMHITVEIIDPVIGNEYLIHLACDAGGGSGDWVRFTYTGLNTWLVELSTGESKTQTWPPVVAGVIPVEACIDSDGFLYGRIASSGDEYPWNDGDATGVGRYYGLGHEVTSAGATFDNFLVEELRTASILCVECFCHCGDNNIEKTLCATLTGTQRAYCMDGLKVDFTWEWNSGSPRWVSEVLTVGSNPFRWIWECQNYDPDNPFDGFKLYWYPGSSPNYKTCCSGNPGGCDAIFTPDVDLSDCDPLSLVYGPFRFTRELSCAACYDFFSGPESGDWYMTFAEGVCP